MQTIQYNNIKWISLKSPTKEELASLKQVFPFHPLEEEEMLVPTRHSKINFYDDHFFMVLHLPVFDKEKKIITAFEIDFVITKTDIISIQYGGRHEELEKLFQELELSDKQRSVFMAHNTGFLLYKILERLYDALFPQFDYITKRVDSLEKELLVKQDIETTTQLAKLRTEVLDFRRSIKPNTSIIKTLNAKAVDTWGLEMGPYFSDLLIHDERLNDLVNSELETLSILYDSSQTLIGNRIDEVVKTLTVFAVIVFPLTLFSSIFGMNVRKMPIIGHEYDFWIIVGLMAVATIIMLIFFKLKKWL